MRHGPGLSPRVWALAALGLVGCTATTTALEVNVRMDDMVIDKSTKVRLVVSSADGSMFPMTAAPMDVRPDVSVRNFDIDGDGSVDIVIEFSPKYPIAHSNRFRLAPGHITRPLPVILRVEVLDYYENRIARLGGPSAAQITATINPGKVTQVEDLKPVCIGDCTPTLKRTTMGATTTMFSGAALDGVAAGNLTGAAPRRADLAVASRHEDRTTAVLNAGVVRVYFGGATLSASPDVTVLGAEPGGQLGAALVAADLDGDGADDLVLGAPGAGNTAGAVYVLYGAATWPPSIDLASPPSNLGVVSGLAAGDRLGEGLALADTDGDGHPDVLAGAPGASRLYVLRSAALPRGGMGDLSQAPSLAGPAGSDFGRVVAARAGHVAVTAPLDGMGAVYVVNAVPLPQATAGLSRLVGAGGGFGAGMTFADVDGSGHLSLAVAAPDDGSGSVSLFALDGLAGGDTPVSAAQSSLRVTPPDGRLGAALASFSQPLGDVILAGAPSSGSGMAFLVGGPTLQVRPSLRLEADGNPAAAAVSGDHDGDGFGSHLLLDDFNHDGVLDLVVGAAHAKTLYLFPGPLQ
jgi:FG-GAP repeat